MYSWHLHCADPKKNSYWFFKVNLTLAGIVCEFTFPSFEGQINTEATCVSHFSC